jgi:hypothetical protein
MSCRVSHLALGLLITLLGCTGGYTFTGGDVGDAKTVSVANFPNYAELFQPNLSQNLTETGRDIFLQQTRLELVPREGDLHFEGEILEYRITPNNPQADATIAQNRLTITVNVRFFNSTDESKNYEQKFTRFRDYDATVDLSEIEEELIAEINQELAENILNAAIANW